MPGGVKTVYITDSPIVSGPRFPEARAPGGGSANAGAGGTDGIKSEIEAVRRATSATERTFKAGIAALNEVKDEDSFFVAVDPFDPVDAAMAPPIYVRPGVVEKDGIGPMSGRLVELAFSDGDTKPLRSAYRDHVEEVDGWVGTAPRQGARRHARLRARRQRHRAR